MAEPFVPPEKAETPRESLLKVLGSEPVTARELSQTVGLSEREVLQHLEHLQKSLKTKNRRLEIKSPECLDCGYLFRKRTRLTRPGKCPLCRSTHLTEPKFHIR